MSKNEFHITSGREKRDLTGSEIMQYSKSAEEKVRQKAFFRKRRNGYLLLSAIILLVVGIFISGGFSTGEEDRPLDKELVVQLSSSVQDIDPAYAWSDGEITIARLVFQGLVAYDAQGVLSPALAERWEVTDGGRTITFYLKNNVYFHNGRNVTAGDCKFTWERSLRVSAPTSYIFENIVGAGDVLADRSKELSGVEVVDDYTLRVHLAAPQPDFLTLLAQPAAAVLDRFELVEQGTNFARPGGSLPSGIGPFRLVEWNHGEHLVLGINDLYWAEKPWLERIKFILNLSAKDTFVSFDAGEIDIIQDFLLRDATDWWGKPGQLNLYTEPVRLVHFVALNDQKAPFNNVAIRNSIMLAISADDALAAGREGKGAVLSGLFTAYWRTLSAGDPNGDNGNLDAAKAILANNGFAGGQGVPPIVLYCSDTVEDQAVAESIQSDLAELGLQVTVSPMSHKDLRLAIRRGEVSFYTMQFADKGGGIDTFFYEIVDGRYQKVINSSGVNSLLQQGYFAETDRKYQLFEQIEENLVANHSLKFLYTVQTSVLSSEKWQGVVVTNGGNLILEQIQEAADIIH